MCDCRVHSHYASATCSYIVKLSEKTLRYTIETCIFIVLAAQHVFRIYSCTCRDALAITIRV